MEKKLFAEEEHKKEVDEQRYKRLLHLLNQSKFYSSYILEKIEKSTEKRKISQRTNKATSNKENETPSNKENKAPNKRERKKVNLEKYDIGKYVSADVSNKKRSIKSEKIKFLL